MGQGYEQHKGKAYRHGYHECRNGEKNPGHEAFNVSDILLLRLYNGILTPTLHSYRGVHSSKNSTCESAL